MNRHLYLAKATAACLFALYYYQVAWESMRDYRWRCGR